MARRQHQAESALQVREQLQEKENERVSGTESRHPTKGGGVIRPHMNMGGGIRCARDRGDNKRQSYYEGE